jgi:DNA primase
MMMIELKQNIDLAQIVRESGVELRSSGTRKVGRCPFHEDRTPSFFVFNDNHYKCFSCGEYGDVIDFTQKMYGLSFRAALRFLGIEQGRVTPKIREDIKRRKHRAELVKQFKDWLNQYTAYIGDLIIKAEELLRGGIPPSDLDLYAELLHGLPVWEYHLSILTEGSDEEKFLLYKNKEARNGKGFRFRKTT